MPEPPVEGRDYYVETGRWVFTEAYHRARGYCCQSGCRHCPWGYGKSRWDADDADPDPDESGDQTKSSSDPAL